jgi:uncharacterized membrane protein YphA (DoxX/SURF4 family)
MSNRALNLGLLLVRIGLGLQFLTYALVKLTNPAPIQRQVLESQMLPPTLASLYAALIPWWELAFGIGFLVGFGTRFVGGSAALALISYTIYVSISSHYTVFGFSSAGLDRNVALILCALGLALAGAGAYSADGWFNRAKRYPPTTTAQVGTQYRAASVDSGEPAG